MILIATLVAFASCEARSACRSREQIAQSAVRRLAYDAYPQWRHDHQDAVARGDCPTMHDLGEYMNEGDARDPWGHDFALLCGPAAPPAAKGFGVRSAGPDRTMLTDDDVVSWAP